MFSSRQNAICLVFRGTFTYVGTYVVTYTLGFVTGHFYVYHGHYFICHTTTPNMVGPTTITRSNGFVVVGGQRVGQMTSRLYGRLLYLLPYLTYICHLEVPVGTGKGPYNSYTTCIYFGNKIVSYQGTLTQVSHMTRTSGYVVRSTYFRTFPVGVTIIN